MSAGPVMPEAPDPLAGLDSLIGLALLNVGCFAMLLESALPAAHKRYWRRRRWRIRRRIVAAIERLCNDRRLSAIIRAADAEMKRADDEARRRGRNAMSDYILKAGEQVRLLADDYVCADKRQAARTAGTH